MKNLLTEEERKSRIKEVRSKGVYFHTSLDDSRNTPISREDANVLIERNMDAFIGNSDDVLSPEETIKYFQEHVFR